MIAQLVALACVTLGAVALAVYGMGEQRRRGPKDTVAPAFHQFSDEVGRVAEEGAAIHVALGNSDFLGQQGMVSIAALQGLSGLMNLAAAYDTPPFITVGDPTLYLLTDHQLRDAYVRLANIQNYKPGFVRYLPAAPVLYAAMAATLTYDEAIGTNINLGSFDQEVTFLTDAAARKNVKVLGGAASATGIAALAPAIPRDRLIMGETLFAGGGETTERSVFWASLKVQNLLRWLVVVAIIAVAGASLLGLGG